MAKAKKKAYLVKLEATLPCSASLRVLAESEDEAREYAEINYKHADWSGGDAGDIPQGCDVSVYAVEEEDNG